MSKSEDLGKISREPLSQNSGASFCTHILKQASGFLYFEPTLMGKAFWLIFQTLGILAICMGIASLFFEEGGLASLLICEAVGIAFLVLGIAGQKNLNRERKFDWRTRTIILPYSINPMSLPQQLSFSEVLALQILKKTVHSSEHNFDSYELNLVLKNHHRINIVDHSGESQIQKDAQRIAEILNCSVVLD